MLSVSRVSNYVRYVMGFATNIHIVSEALVRYINQGITLGSVNIPEVQLRSLTSDEPDTARVSLHRKQLKMYANMNYRLSSFTETFPVCSERSTRFLETTTSTSRFPTAEATMPT